MQIYKEYPDLGSMLQLGYCAAYMQQYAATWTFFWKKTIFNIPKYKNITPLQKIKHNKATVYQLYDMQHFQLICSKYAANMLQNLI